MDILALLGAAVGLVGGMAGILSWFNQRKQTQLMQQQIEAIAIRDRTYNEWSTRYDQAIEALIRISPAIIATAPATSTVAWGKVFGSEKTRERIERYLGRRSRFASKFEPAPLSKDQLLNPVIQEIIQEVLNAVEKFNQEHPDWARQIKLLPP